MKASSLLFFLVTRVFLFGFALRLGLIFFLILILLFLLLGL